MTNPQYTPFHHFIMLPTNENPALQAPSQENINDLASIKIPEAELRIAALWSHYFYDALYGHPQRIPKPRHLQGCYIIGLFNNDSVIDAASDRRPGGMYWTFNRTTKVLQHVKPCNVWKKNGPTEEVSMHINDIQGWVYHFLYYRLTRKSDTNFTYRYLTEKVPGIDPAIGNAEEEPPHLTFQWFHLDKETSNITGLAQNQNEAIEDSDAADSDATVEEDWSSIVPIAALNRRAKEKKRKHKEDDQNEEVESKRPHYSSNGQEATTATVKATGGLLQQEVPVEDEVDNRRQTEREKESEADYIITTDRWVSYGKGGFVKRGDRQVGHEEGVEGEGIEQLGQNQNRLMHAEDEMGVQGVTGFDQNQDEDMEDSDATSIPVAELNPAATQEPTITTALITPAHITCRRNLFQERSGPIFGIGQPSLRSIREDPGLTPDLQAFNDRLRLRTKMMKMRKRAEEERAESKEP
jgi:hypothetical protein